MVMLEWPVMPFGIHHVGLVRQYPVACETSKLFVASERFTCIRGRKYWKNGEIVFPRDETTDRHTPFLNYRSRYGWNFASSGVIFARTDANMRFAMRRITGARDPRVSLTKGLDLAVQTLEIQYYDTRLRINQHVFIFAKMSQLKQLMLEQFGLAEYTASKVQSAIDLLNEQHSKRMLRIQALTEIYETARLADEVWLDRVLLKMKPDEIAKNGKYPRMIVDLGVAASLEGAGWAGAMKHHIGDKPLVYNNCCVTFCSTPDPNIVMNHFREMHTHQYRLYMVVFSDDAILSVCIDGVYSCYNMDIASCDTSHTPDLFACLFDSLNCPADIRLALEKQIMADMLVMSVDKKRTCTLRPDSFYLQSGITITTLINSLCQFLMLIAFADSPVLDPESIMLLAESVGYKVTLEVCEIPEDIQFLKMSPTLSCDGEYYATLNLGVIFRASGCARGDLPVVGPRRDHQTDAANFQSCLMSGLLSMISHPELEQLAPNGIHRDARSYALAGTIANALAHVDHTLGGVHVFDDAIFRRYRLTLLEIEQLKDCIRRSCFGTVSYCEALCKVFNKDYSLWVPNTAGYEQP